MQFLDSQHWNYSVTSVISSVFVKGLLTPNLFLQLLHYFCLLPGWFPLLKPTGKNKTSSAVFSILALLLLYNRVWLKSCSTAFVFLSLHSSKRMPPHSEVIPQSSLKVCQHRIDWSTDEVPVSISGRKSWLMWLMFFCDLKHNSFMGKHCCTFTSNTNYLSYYLPAAFMSRQILEI